MGVLYVSTYLTFWVLFLSDYCHRVFLFSSPFKRCLRINNLNFIHFDHPSRSCENFQICFPAQKKLSHQSSPCKKPFWALKTQCHLSGKIQMFFPLPNNNIGSHILKYETYLVFIIEKLQILENLTWSDSIRCRSTVKMSFKVKEFGTLLKK